MIFVLISSLLNASLVSNVAIWNQAGIEQIKDEQNRVKATLVYVMWISAYTLIVYLLMYGVNQLMLRPFDLTYLQTFLTAIIMVITSLVSINFIKVSYFRENQNKILLNTVTLIIVLLTLTQNNLLIGLFQVVGYLIGYGLVMTIYNLTMYRLKIAPVPKPFVGVAIGLVVLSLLSIAFYGLGGLF